MAAVTDDVLAEFVELSKVRRAECGIALALKTLDAKEGEALKAALASESITSVAIETWLKRRNVKVSDRTLNRHRKGQCACDD